MGRLYYNRDNEWAVWPLRPGSSVLAGCTPGTPWREDDTTLSEASPDWTLRFMAVEAGDDGSKADVLLSRGATRVRVNGHLLTSGLKVLEHRSIVSVAGRHYFYSAEEPAQVEEFVPGESPVFCPRCNDALTGGDAVRCTGCKLWFHQSQTRPCFSYSEQCPICNTSTVLGEETWTPMEL